METPKAGQIWKDNYIAAGGATRFVKVTAVPATVEPKTDIEIQRCGADGADIPHSPKRTTKAERFNGKKSGFSLHQDVAPVAPATETQGAHPGT